MRYWKLFLVLHTLSNGMYSVPKHTIIVDIAFAQAKAFLLRYPAPMNIGYL